MAGRFGSEKFPVNQSVTVLKSNKSLINGEWMPEAVSLKLNFKASAGIPRNKGFPLLFTENMLSYLVGYWAWHHRGIILIVI